jgi:hypothetical protein
MIDANHVALGVLRRPDGSGRRRVRAMRASTSRSRI